MVKKILLTLLLIWFALLVFMPKQEIYYALEKELSKQGIEINEQNIEEGWFSLRIGEAAVYGKGIKIATVEKLTCHTLLFYTKIEIDHVVLDDSLKAVLPQTTDKILLTYSLLSPLTVWIHAEGVFGRLEGSADLKERKLHIEFTEVKEIGTIRSELKKGERGWYYEKSF